MHQERRTDPGAASFAKLFDHSIVRPDATREQVIEFAETAAVVPDDC